MFKNLGNLTQLAGMLKNLGQVRGRLAESKERLATERVVGEDTSSSVRIEMNGLGEVIAVTVNTQVLTPELQMQVQESIQIATNLAIQQAKRLHLESIRSLTQGVELPGLEGIMEELAK